MGNKIAYLTAAIENWYRNAKLDYGITGMVKEISADAENDRISVTVVEDGEELSTAIEYVSDYSPEQVYNIWMEFC